MTGLVCLALAGCTVAPTVDPSTLVQVTQAPSATPIATLTAVTSPTLSPEVIPSQVGTILDPTPSATPDTRPLPEDWQSWPAVPAVSGWLKELYAEGLAAGNNPQAFSKVGDCQNVDSMFLSPFDSPPEYRLGEEYAYLQPTIDQFSGSWERHSQAVRGGFNVASVFSSMMSDKTVCGKEETPLDCEFRLNRPSIVVISMETWCLT